MPYSVLKKSKTCEDRIEVAGEFQNEADAYKFVEESLQDDADDNDEHMVDPPPKLVD